MARNQEKKPIDGNWLKLSREARGLSVADVLAEMDSYTTDNVYLCQRTNLATPALLSAFVRAINLLKPEFPTLTVDHFWAEEIDGAVLARNLQSAKVTDSNLAEQANEIVSNGLREGQCFPDQCRFDAEYIRACIDRNRITVWLRKVLLDAGIAVVEATSQPTAVEESLNRSGLTSRSNQQVDNAPTAGRPTKQIPFRRNPFFAGREQIIADLFSYIRAEPPSLMALSGLGGVGKTQVAIEFALRFSEDFGSVIWLSGHSEQALRKSIEATVKRLDLPFDAEDKNHQGAVDSLQTWMGQEKGWLAVIDNVDELDSLGGCIPNNVQGHVLMTSRLRVFDRLGIVELFELGEFQECETREFLAKRIRLPSFSFLPESSVGDLHVELGGLPLALEQASAFIVETQLLSLGDYLNEFRQNRLKLLAKVNPQTGNYNETIATTWLMNFQEVAKVSEASAELLRVTAFLKDSTPIAFEFLIDAADRLPKALRSSIQNAAVKPIAVSLALAPLARYSLVRVEASNQTYAMHPLVKEVIRSLDEI